MDQRKQAEIRYFDEMDASGREHARRKPFSDVSRGHMLVDIGQVLTLLPAPPLRLLDLGCGSGWTTAMFARSGYHALGVDLAPTAIEIARQDLSWGGAQFASYDFEALPYRQEFDAAVFYDSLHHCSDLGAVLSSAHDALKPGGCLIVVEPGSGHNTTERAREAHRLHGVTERDMPPALSVPILERLEFSSVRIVPRLSLQLPSRTSPSRKERLVSRLLGRRAADVLKAIWSHAKIRSNGIVVAIK